MKKSALSMLFFAFYLATLSLAFIFFPNPFITIFGFEETSEVWVRILGYVLGMLAFYFIMAVLDNATNFYRWSVYARLLTLPAFLIFVLFGIAPPVLTLFGVVDTPCALWTALALKMNVYPKTSEFQ